MKEAAGEANMTVVTIILIAAIVAVVTPIITNMMKNTGYKTCCMDAGGTKVDNQHNCTGGNADKDIYDACLSEAGLTATGK